jgi:uncharacterized membrane protein YfcA
MRTRKALTFILLVIAAVLVEQAFSQVEADIQCTDSSQCMALYECVNQECVHKDLFPLTAREIITMVLLVLIAGPAHGLGAGSIMQPIVLIGFNYDTAKSTMIMQSLILGGSFGAFLNTFWRRNPRTGKPVIDYDVTMVVMPLTVCGVLIGVTAKIAAPQIVIILCLVLIEFVTVRRLLRKARELGLPPPIPFFSSAPAVTPAGQEPLLPVLGKPVVEGAEGIEGMANIELKQLTRAREDERLLEEKQVQQRETQVVQNRELESILKEDKRLFPMTKLFWVFLLLAWMIGTTMLRSGKILDLSYCGPRYWLVFALTLVGCYLLGVRNRYAVARRTRIKISNGFSSEADFLLKPGVLDQLGTIAFVAGIFAGFLGIGAGTIIGPYLLAYGCPPGVQGPTMAFGIVQSAFVASAASVLLSNSLHVIELVVFFGIAVAGSYIVNRIISFFIGKYNKPAINLWIMIGIVGSSCIVMPIFLIYKSIENPTEMLAYRWIC